MFVPRFTVAGLLSLALSITSVTIAAERPTSSKLLPKATAACLRIADAPGLAKDLKKTALGRILQDPKMKPLVGQLWGTVAKELSRFEERLGVTTDEMLSIPQGEAVLALVTPEDEAPVLVAILDCGSGMPAMQKLIDRGVKAMEKRGSKASSEKHADTEIKIYLAAGRRQRQLAFFVKDNTLVVGSKAQVLKNLLDVWNGGDAKTLSANERYAAIMKHCRGAKNEKPQISWFVDPVSIAKSAASQSPRAQIGLALLPTLGLDGFHGLGGTVALATSKYDAVTHTHMLLEKPRRGIVEMLALKSGDVTPEAWVPGDVANYATIHWDVKTTYEKLGKMIDSFQGEGALAKRVKRDISDRLELDFEKDLLAASTGRFTYFSRFDHKSKTPAQGHMLAIHMQDGKAFKKTMTKLLKRADSRMKKKSYAGEKYYYFTGKLPRREVGDDPAQRPSVCLLGDVVLLSNRGSLIEVSIRTSKDSSKSLAQSLDYKLIAGKAKPRSGSKPVMFSFNRPEEGLRFAYNLVSSERVRTRLADGAKRNNFFKGVNQALKENPLPPFKVLSRYVAPGGSVLSDEETGLHYMTFTLKRE